MSYFIIQNKFINQEGFRAFVRKTVAETKENSWIVGGFMKRKFRGNNYYYLLVGLMNIYITEIYNVLFFRSW